MSALISAAELTVRYGEPEFPPNHLLQIEHWTLKMHTT